MTEEMNNFAPEVDAGVLSTQKKKMRRAFSRAGWAVLVLTVATNVISLALGLFVPQFGEAQLELLNKNILYLNEVMLLLAILVAAAVFIGMPKEKPTKSKVSLKEFLLYLCICCGIGYVGNIIGSTMLTVWNTITGNEVTNQLVEVLSMVDPLQVAICTGILAPILEEFFFRKLLIDRTRKYGELAAILVSAGFFGIFHQNFSQFFYAFGIGALLAYVYCKTGSYITVTLLHVAFNVIMGVIPSLISPDVLVFLEEIAAFEGENTEALIALFSEYAKPLLIYLAYALVQGTLNVLGIVLFFLNMKKIQIKKSELLISGKDQARATLLNVGVIAAFVLLVGLTVSTLFT